VLTGIYQVIIRWLTKQVFLSIWNDLVNSYADWQRGREKRILLMMLYRTLLAAVTINLISCGRRSDVPDMPDIEICRVVWSQSPYCRCVSLQNPDIKNSYPKEECNISLRPGGWATLMDYTHELQRRLKDSQKKWLSNASAFAKED